MSDANNIPPLSVIIPTRDMGEHVAVLLSDIYKLDPQPFSHVIVVDDASTDDSVEKIRSIAAKLATAEKPQLHLLCLPENLGRFGARAHGAQYSPTEKIIFLDSRVRLAENFAKDFRQLPFDKEPCLMGMVDIDTAVSIFSLYWDKSHKFVFSKHYQASKHPFYLTQDNYDSYLKGTTVFLCDRQLFIDSCVTFATPPRSDDTALMQVIVKQQPIMVHPLFRILWQPRLNLCGFLARLWERGPYFVEYHGYNLNSPFFIGIWLFVLASIAFVACCILKPLWGLRLFVVGLLSIALSSELLTTKPQQSLRLAPLHTLVVLTFLAGIWHGMVVIAWNALRSFLQKSKRRLLWFDKPTDLPPSKP